MKTEPMSDIDVKSEPISEIELMDWKIEIPNSPRCNSPGSDLTEPYNPNDYPELEPMDESNCSTETYENSSCKSGSPDLNCEWCKEWGLDCPWCDEDL